MIDNSDHLDPDSFSSSIAVEDTYPTTLHLTAVEEVALTILLHKNAQKLEWQARRNCSSAVLRFSRRQRADEALRILNAFLAAEGREEMTADNIIHW